MRFWLIPLFAAGLCVAAAAPEKLTGVVGDDMCAGDHKRMGGTDAMKCTAECVKGMGAKYALIVGTDVYEFADQKKAAKFVGKKVTVEGEVNTTTTGKNTVKTINAKSISPTKE